MDTKNRSVHGYTLKLMSYNIQIGIQSIHNPKWDPQKVNLDAIVEQIQRESPDIVALQEVDRYRRRSNYVDQAAYLAQVLNMHFAFSPSFYSVETEHGRGMYGNAILSRFHIECSYRHALRKRNVLESNEPKWAIEPRSILESKIDFHGTSIRVYATHLSTATDQQKLQIEDIENVLNQVKGPQILMGDFNAEPDMPHMNALFNRLQSPLDDGGFDGFRNTYPSGSKAETAIDYIFVSRDFEVERAYVVQDDAGVSDHNPVIAHVVFNPN